MCWLLTRFQIRFIKYLFMECFRRLELNSSLRAGWRVFCWLVKSPSLGSSQHSSDIVVTSEEAIRLIREGGNWHLHWPIPGGDTGTSAAHQRPAWAELTNQRTRGCLSRRCNQIKHFTLSLHVGVLTRPQAPIFRRWVSGKSKLFCKFSDLLWSRVSRVTALHWAAIYVSPNPGE